MDLVKAARVQIAKRRVVKQAFHPAHLQGRRNRQQK
jgi:hypothetical protein